MPSAAGGTAVGNLNVGYREAPCDRRDDRLGRVAAAFAVDPFKTFSCQFFVPRCGPSGFGSSRPTEADPRSPAEWPLRPEPVIAVLSSSPAAVRTMISHSFAVQTHCASRPNTAE